MDELSINNLKDIQRDVTPPRQIKSNTNEEASRSNNTPPHIKNLAEEITSNLLPAKSKDIYLKAYENFMQWKKEEGINSLSESALV